MANRDPLSPDSLARLIKSTLPPTSTIRNPYDAIAVLCHACMLAIDFRLVGLGEEHRISPPSEEEGEGPSQQLPQEWNTSGTSYSFRYSHPQSSMEYLLKINRMGTKAVIMGMGLGDDRTASFEVAVREYVVEDTLPLTFPGSGLDEGEAEHHQQQQERLKTLFLQTRPDLPSLFKVNILQKIIPGLHKEGYEETSTTSSNEQSREQGRRRRDDDGGEQPQPARPYPYDDDPLALPPRGNRNPYPAGDFPPPGFEDEYDIMRPPRGMGPVGGGGMGGGGGGGIRGGYPLGIGHDDLYPPGLAPHDPLQGPFMPGPGMGGRPHGGGQGGMHPTFDDPLFMGGGGGMGQGGYDPSHPPGARFDPVGPGIPPPSGSGSGPRGSGLDPFRGPPGPFGGGGRGGGGGGGFGGGPFI
ncbi:MAG: hypothetical protein M1823_002048 [Watsoniomyces obsoletus]|nr:MAG: hypothetical protein M1823_002048 [Watsoniomyces obsoletus]